MKTKTITKDNSTQMDKSMDLEDRSNKEIIYMKVNGFWTRKQDGQGLYGRMVVGTKESWKKVRKMERVLILILKKL